MISYNIGKSHTGFSRVALKGMLMASAAMITFSGQAYAQDEEEAFSFLVEEIVITAQKREQNLSDVSIAVTAFSGAQMTALGMESSTDLISYAPGVSLAGDIGGQRAIFNIRGVVQNDYADIAEAPVAVYVDGGYLASTQAQTFGLFDIERVEILKGPQGTLFGRNATGGLVNTITAKPTEETEGYFALTGARFSNVRGEGAISGSLSEGVRARLSVMYNHQGNILENVYSGTDAQGVSGSVGGGENGYNDKTFAARFQIEADLGDSATLLLSANYADTEKSEGPYQVVNTTEVQDDSGNVVDVIFAKDDPLGCFTLLTSGVCAGGATRPVQGGDFFGNLGDPDGSGNKVNKDFAFDDQNQIESKGLSATLDWDIGEMNFVSVTDYKEFDRTIGLDSDQTATPALIFQSDGKIEQLSQEFRLSGTTDRVKWVTGLFYLGIDTDYIQGLAGSPSSTYGFLEGGEVNTLVDLTTDSYSIFGQVDVDLNEKLVLVMGARYIKEDKNLEGAVHWNANLNDRLIEVTGPATDIVDIDNDQNLWSAKAVLEYKAGDDALYYIGVNRGVKAGSFNAPLIGGFSAYDPEVLWAYEAGTKLTLAGGRARLNGSVFYYDYNDYQSFSWVNNAGLVFNENASFKGAEIELTAAPAPGFDMLIGASYLDADVKDLEVASGVFADTRPPFTPEFQFSGLLRYTHNIASGEISAQVNGTYQTKVFSNSRNFTAHDLGDRFQMDARISWTDAEGEWSATAFVDNVTNSGDAVIGFDVSGFYGTSQVSYLKPRTYGVSLSKHF